jgi:hypothetical protein
MPPEIDPANPAPPIEVDEFAAAFAESNLAPAPEAKPAEPAAPEAPADPAKPAAPAEPADPAKPAAPAAPTPEAPAPADPAPKEAPAAPEGYVSAAEFAALKAQMDALSKAPPAAPAPPAPEAPAPEVKPVYNQSETDFLKKYEEDWPDISQGEALKRRAEYQQLVQHVFDTMSPIIAELRAQTGRVADRTQLEDLETLIPDYHTVRDPAIAWVQSQPPRIKAGFEEVTRSGTPEEVKALIDTWRTMTGYKPPEEAPPPAGAPPAAAAAPTPPVVTKPAPNAALPAAAAAAAAALKPVNTARSQPQAAADPNDFDSAFAEFAAAK